MVLHDPPYTLPEEDPFNIKPLLQQPRRRRSSMLDKWIQDQQHLPIASDDVSNDLPLPLIGTRSNPYLAYPELGSPMFNPSTLTVNSYDLVEDEDIPYDAPATPTTSPSRRSSKLLQTPSSFRHLHLSFRSGSPSTSTTSRSPRTLLFQRVPRSSTDSCTKSHTRSPSLSTLETAGPSSSPKLAPSGKSRWRPSVLGHFSLSSASQSSVEPSETVSTPPRPSISSNNTYTTTTTTATTVDDDIPTTPQDLSLVESIRSRSNGAAASSISVWSGAFSSSYNLNDAPPSPFTSRRASSTISASGFEREPLAPKPKSRLSNNAEEKAAPVKRDPNKPDSTRPHVAYSSSTKGGTLRHVSFSSLGSRQQKKKILVITGIAATDIRKFDGVKHWCESFGEVSQITRMPNSDLHVNFRHADVADTVCRLRAKVYIRGVGSVQLSWHMSNKR